MMLRTIAIIKDITKGLYTKDSNEKIPIKEHINHSMNSYIGCILTTKHSFCYKDSNK